MPRDFDPHEPELMDLPQPVTPELEKDLANLVGLNRHFGSHRIVRKFLRGWLAADRPWRVLDLATGAGDIPRLIATWAKTRGIAVEIDAVDANPATLEIASRQSAAHPEIRWHRGDALTFGDPGAYDVVCCSLALHHFSEADAVTLLRRCRELSRRFVLVTDLERSVSTRLGVWLVTALIYRDPMTKFDGRLSARRAFSFAEMRTLAGTAGWRDFGHSRFLFCRQAVWLERAETREG
jgi:SAM-dependent methyltransferase